MPGPRRTGPPTPPDPLNPADPVSPDDPFNPADPLSPDGPFSPADRFNPDDPFSPDDLNGSTPSADPLGSANRLGPADPRTPADTRTPADPLGPADPRSLADPTGPANPRSAADPLSAADPTGRADPRSPADRASPFGPPGPALPVGSGRLTVPDGPVSHTGPFSPTGPQGPFSPAAPDGLNDPFSPAGPVGSNGSASPAGLVPPEAPNTPAPLRPAPRRPRTARHGSASSGPSRKSAPTSRQVKRARIAGLAIVGVGVLVIGLATGFGSELSAEPTAQAFLLDWEQQHYAAADALTSASPGTAAADLKGAFAQLDATQLFLAMDSITQHGSTAQASYTATVDLAEEGRVWTYHGHFGLDESGGTWKVQWAPSVVYPGLGQGQRLAVVTQFPDRASVLDAEGQPLQVPSLVYVVGVKPAALADPAATAEGFAKATGLDAGQVLGQITAAPPNQFLKLASLDPANYSGLRSALRHVPGLEVQRERTRLFQTEATGLVGEVGNETDSVLRNEGEFYLPGTTVGLSGLEQRYQRQLLGAPTTEVVAVTSAGAQVGVFARWPGAAGTPVRTTISSKVQNAALTALGGVSGSGEIVAVQASTGNVLAVAQHQAPGSPAAADALNGKLTPGTAFTIVSAAALLGAGVTTGTPISCENSFTVGGQTFTSGGTGATQPFKDDFADACRTAFAGLSYRLTTSQFEQVVKGFGIGADWSALPIPAFSGSVPSAAGLADLAAETIGQGNVQMSPLAMAMVAAAVDWGSWHTPQFIQGSADPSGTALDPSYMNELRALMRGAVRSGAAHAASQPGAAVYGQVGMVHTGSTWTSWFVGYRDDIAFTVIESGKTAHLSAAALAGAFLSALGG